MRTFSIFAALFILLSIVSGATAQDEERILFVSDRDSGIREVYTMNPDGSDIRRLTNNEDQDLDPMWSPDRSQIVFSSSRDGKLNIYTMSANGGNQRRLTTSDNAYNEYPAWSPDGRQIVYVSDISGDYDVFIIAANGGDPRRLTQTEERETDPAWSPDGRQIVFLREVDFVSKIFIMNNDGSGARRLVSDIEDSSDDFRAPSWSPDSTQLAYAVTYFFQGQTSITDINVMNMNTGESSLVTSLTEAYVSNITWSPDGDSLVYEVQQGGARESGLNEISLDGTSSRVLTGSDLNAQAPSWASPRLTRTIQIGDGAENYSPDIPPDSNIRCPGALPTRVVVGEVAAVTPGPNGNRLRSGPGTNNRQIGRIPPQGRFLVLEGPVCNGGYAWWRVDYQGLEGWTAEANDEEYWLYRLEGQGNTAGLQILTGGIGRTNGARMGPGEFQVEYYCSQRGYGVSRDDRNWYCMRGSSRVQTLQQNDFNQICRDTYNESEAIARRYGDGEIPAFRWRCYVERSSSF